MNTFWAVLGGVFLGIIGATAVIGLCVMLFFGYALSRNGPPSTSDPSCVVRYDRYGNMQACP